MLTNFIFLKISKLEKFSKIFALFFLSIALVSCNETGCIEADEFNNKSVKVESNPINDGVFGTYDDVDGGQVAEWHETGLRTANEDFIIFISGGFVPWKASTMTQKKLDGMTSCFTRDLENKMVGMCAKRQNDPTQNCICYKNKTPEPEIGMDGNPVAANCSSVDNQNNPSLCTCTKTNGIATDYGIFHFPLNYYNKDHSRKNPDEQSDACKYDRGLGLYLGVFGRSSNEMPIRVYHLFTEEEVCSIKRNSKGECIDEDGNNRLKYVFRSKDQKTFVKDDFSGNDGTDTDSGDNSYHKPNEFLKLIIYDRYYSDNYGHYNVEFLKGVIDNDDIGLLEFLINIVEDQMLGEINDEGEREGGILKFMYNAIAKDLHFMALFQMCLVLYIGFFGLSSLLGLVELNKKEIYGRILKLSVVIFFVNPDSWEFYRQIVVGFFHDGMGFVVDMIVGLGEKSLDEETNPLVLAQLASGNPGSTGSRFSYIDTMLRILFSENVTKKIWGLFFYDILGLVYILAIYALIAFFTYVMLIAASAYAVTLMKLIFALALGPIFISFSLFKQTNEMFKKWIGFIGARSLEIVILFLLLFILVMLIDKKFNEILHYPVCADYLASGFFNIKILKAKLDRNMVEWMSMLTTLAIFIFMANVILEQIPTLAGSLVSIGGIANKGGDGTPFAASGFKVAGGMIGEGLGLAKSAAGTVLGDGGGAAFRGARAISRASGLSGAADSVLNKIPFRGPRSLLRDATIDSAISKGKAAATKKGLTGKDFDMAVRNFVMNDPKQGINAWKTGNPTKAALYDMTNKTIADRLDKKLVQDPLKSFIKTQAKQLKKLDPSQIPLGKDMTRQLEEDARRWASSNLAGGSSSIDSHLSNMNKFIRHEGKLTSKQAAKRFGDDDNLTNKYLQHLKDRQFEKKGKKEGEAFNTPKHAKEFMKMVDERKISFGDRLTGAKVSASAARSLDSLTKNAMQDSSRKYLANGEAGLEKIKAENYYKAQDKNAKTSFEQREIERAKQARMEEIDKKREFHKQALDGRVAEKLNRELVGASASRKLEMQHQAYLDYKTMQASHMAKIDELTGNPNWKEIMKKNGGIENYRDGLIDIDGNSLFEAQARWNRLRTGDDSAFEKADLNAKDSLKSQLEEVEDRISAAEKTKQDIANMNERIAESEERLTQARKANDAEAAALAAQSLGALEKDHSILMKEADLSVGQSIADALAIQSSNIGLTTGDVSIGGAKSGAIVDNVLVSSFESSKMISESKLKMKKFEMATKEYELSKLESSGGDAKAINALKKEVEDLNYEVSTESRRVETIESQITSAKAGTT